MEVIETVEIVETAADAAMGAPKNDIWGMVLYCAVILGIIYFLIVRPNRKRMAEYQKMIDGLKIGSKIIAGGIHGTIKKIGDKTFDVEIAKGLVVTVSKQAVAGVEN